jgi:hypothetical protein
MIAWARTEAPTTNRADHDAFVDYWRGRPGAGGRKLDWIATWRNWMRREHERRSRVSPNGTPRGFVERNGHRLKAETAANLDLIERMRLLDEQGQRPAIERSPR